MFELKCDYQRIMEQLLINQQGNLTSIIHAVGQLTKAEFDALFMQMKKLRIKNYPIATSKTEADLLMAINKGLPVKLQKRYDVLLKKRCDETLTGAEYTEILELTDKKEALQEERLQSMIELAKLRNVSLSELAEQLELNADLYVV